MVLNCAGQDVGIVGRNKKYKNNFFLLFMILFVLILHPVLRTVSSLNTSAKVRQTDEENEGI